MRRRRGALFIGLLLSAVFYCLPVSAQAEPFEVKQAVFKPILDGTISADEWGEPLYVLRPEDNTAYLSRYSEEVQIPEEMRVYMMWDQEYLYLAVTVEGTYHRNNQTEPQNGWNGNAILLTLTDGKGQDRLSCALGGNGEALFGLHNRPLNKVGASRDQASQIHNGAIRRTAKQTVYEVQISLEQLEYTALTSLPQGATVSFAVEAFLADEEKGLYAGSFLYAAAKDAYGQPILPQMTLTEQPANEQFDPQAVTSAAPTETQPETTASTVPPQGTNAVKLPSAQAMRNMLLALLCATALTVLVLIIVLLRRRR